MTENETSSVSALKLVIQLSLESFWSANDLKKDRFPFLLRGVFDYISENQSIPQDEGHLVSWLDSNGRDSHNAWRVALAIDVSNHILKALSEQDLLEFEKSINCRTNRKKFACCIRQLGFKEITKITKEYTVVTLTTGEYQIDHCKDCNYNAAEQHKGSCIVGV